MEQLGGRVGREHLLWLSISIFIAGALGQVGEGGWARKQPLIIPKAVIPLMDRDN
jgi:hypothetical protein